MKPLSIVKFILCLAAVVFIAKPFVGFRVLEQLQDKEQTNLLVKIFTKRKPEFLEEAAYELTAIQELLSSKGSVYSFTINALLLNLFFSIERCLTRLIYRLNPFGEGWLPQAAPIYLLNNRFSI